MKKFVFSLFALALLCSSAQAQVDIFYSTSNSDAFAGNSLNLVEGGSGSLYVWVTNNEGSPIDGMGIDLISSDPTILQATAHNIENPNGDRWFSTEPGVLGDLTDGSVSLALVGLGTDGIASTGSPVLYSEIQFDAAAIGTTELSIVENSFAISVSGNSPSALNTGTATVNVSAVPEPGSLLLLTGAAAIGVLRRRRS